MQKISTELNSRVAIPAMQQIAIDSMLRGKRDALPVSISIEVRAEGLVAAKPACAGRAVRITMTAILAKLLASALVEHPGLNACIDGNDIVRFADVNLGVAIARSDDTLSLAVLRSAQRHSLDEIALQIAALTERARAGKLLREDVGGAGFTLSNVGDALPGVMGTPLLPAGQCGVLLASAPRAAPVVEQGGVVAGLLMSLSLTFDHRVVNGMPAVRFLRAMRDRIEAPDTWL
jgi:pyruvate dehydrogenase E2 component (dihydrolipoamide acetyltransferase)